MMLQHHIFRKTYIYIHKITLFVKEDLKANFLIVFTSEHNPFLEHCTLHASRHVWYSRELLADS